MSGFVNDDIVKQLVYQGTSDDRRICQFDLF